jgi:hypothetical protein
MPASYATYVLCVRLYVSMSHRALCVYVLFASVVCASYATYVLCVRLYVYVLFASVVCVYASDT